MTNDELLASLHARGVELWVERGRLFLRAAPEVLRDGAVVETARQHRAELIAALRTVPTCGDCRRGVTVLLTVVTAGGGEAQLCRRCWEDGPPAEQPEIEIKAKRAPRVETRTAP